MQKHLSPQQPGFLRPLFLMKQPLPLIKWRRHSSGFHQMSPLSNAFEGGAPVGCRAACCPDKQPSQRCCSVLQTGLLFVGGSMLGQQVPGSGAKEKNSLFPSLTLRLPKSPSGDGRKTETLTYHGPSPRMCQPQSVSRYWACVVLMASDRSPSVFQTDCQLGDTLQIHICSCCPRLFCSGSVHGFLLGLEIALTS